MSIIKKSSRFFQVFLGLVFLMSAMVSCAEEITSTPIRTFTGHSSFVWSVAYSPDGQRALSGAGYGEMKLWDINTGAELRTFKGHTSHVNSVAYSPDGQRALSGSDDDTLKLWDVNTGAELRTFTGHTSDVYSVAFSPDGQRALSSSYDNTLKLWDLNIGTVLRTFTGHTNCVTSVTYSQDGQRALSSSYQEMNLWDLNTGAILRTFTGHTDWVRSAAYSPDGQTALSGSVDKTMKLWDVNINQTTTHPVNISTRSPVRGGANNTIAGFIIEGTGNKKVFIKAEGAGLAPRLPAGSQVLSDAKIVLYQMINGTWQII